MNEELKIRITAEVSKLKKAVSDAKGEIKSLASEATKSGSDVQNALKSMGDGIATGMKVGAAAIAGIGVALLSTVGATEEYRRSQAMLATAFEVAGSSASVAKDTYNDLYRVLGDTGQATEAAQQLGKLTTEEKALSEWTNICQGVYATFGESLPIESLAEASNETAKTGQLTGALADALNWAGVSEDEFQAKLEACNSEAEREALIRETLNGLYNEAAETYEKNAEDLLAYNEAQLALEDSLAKVGEALTPVKTALMELGAEILADLTPYIQELADQYLPSIKEALSGLGEKIGEAITWIADHWGLISTIGGILLAISVAIIAVNAALTIYNTVMGIAAIVSLSTVGVFAAIVAGIALVVAAIVLCIKHWDDIVAAIKGAVDKIVQFVKDLVKFVVDDFTQMGENMKQKVEEAKTAVVNKFQEIKTTITTKVQEAKDAVVNKFQEIKTSIETKVEEAKKAVEAKFKAMKDTIVNKVQEAKVAAETKFNEMKTAITNKVSEAKTTVENKFNEIKTAITNKMSEAKTNAVNKFQELVSGIKEKVNAAKDAVESAVEKIKGAFKFSWSLPKPRIPTFQVSGGQAPWGFGGKGSLPRISIGWNALGGIFDAPTLFGYGNGLQGIGEDGAEAVVPLEKNTKWMNVLAERLSALMGGNTPIVLQVDGKTFAEVACANINHLTRQRGQIPLKIM